MKMVFKKIIEKGMYIINYIKKVVERIFKIFIQSSIVCFPIALTLVLINSLLGVHIRFSYYFKLAIITSLGITFLLCILKSESIFAKPVLKSKQIVPTKPAKTDRKTQRNIHLKRKRIS